ncbi:glycerol-3-phosphate acyltransferase [Lentibacillus saliphilus]|uniref:glycerol-3-phosphate acyltransferase n=1 Tax=Lentibacillus saliphilus TaxID=2737028 RepID=UPI001C30C488|nr:glycerol-3-phosphate acyltransferase [Lentibacillus saliphilus]
MNLLLSVVIGYVFGSMHGSQLIGKLKNIDIKGTGLKNAGASNTTMLLGWKYGIAVALIDILKGTIAVVFIKIVLVKLGVGSDTQPVFVYLGALAIVLGHNFPFTMRFKGGKGTASMVGILLALQWQLALVSIGVLLLFALSSGFLVIGVLFMYAAFVTGTYVLYGLVPAITAFIMLALSVVMHRENFLRIYNKEEKKIASFFKKGVE